MPGTAAIPITDATSAAEARRAATSIAARIGFSEELAGRVALLVTEAATNVFRHGGGGELLARAVAGGGRAGIEVLALDKGRGIRNLEQSLRDGYSSAGSSGTGLGAIRRLASEFDVYTAPGKGTALLARVFPGNPAQPVRARPFGAVAWGGVAVAQRGEPVSGDTWAARPTGTGADILVADGLGHGPAAAEAAAAAAAVFDECPALELAELIDRMHGALRSTRGAAVAVARLNPEERSVRYAGVGNIVAGVVSGAGVRQMISYPGTVGHEVHKVHEYTYPWPQGAMLVMHSDGVTAHWTAEEIRALLPHDPTLAAAVIYRDCKRGRDDATVVVARAAGEPAR